MRLKKILATLGLATALPMVAHGLELTINGELLDLGGGVTEISVDVDNTATGTVITTTPQVGVVLCSGDPLADPEICGTAVTSSSYVLDLGIVGGQGEIVIEALTHPSDGIVMSGGDGKGLSLNYDKLAGQVVDMTANDINGSGSAFTSWTGCDTDIGNFCRVTMTADKTTVANYATSYLLSVVKGGAGGAVSSVTSSPAGIDCGATCEASYADGTSVTLTATAGVNASFNSWVGCDTPAGNSCTMEMTQAKSVTANFDATTVTLDVTSAGTGTGTVTSSPAGINCGADCTEDYDPDTVVTLTATPASGSDFAGWSGGGCSGTGTCDVTLDTSKSVTATFNISTYALNVTKAGTGTGSVAGSPGAIDCGATCSDTFDHGTSVTLVATADGGSIFSGWSGGGCSGTGNCVVSMTQAYTVTATFNLDNGCGVIGDHVTIENEVDLSDPGGRVTLNIVGNNDISSTPINNTSGNPLYAGTFTFAPTTGFSSIGREVWLSECPGGSSYDDTGYKCRASGSQPVVYWKNSDSVWQCDMTQPTSLYLNVKNVNCGVSTNCTLYREIRHNGTP